MKKTLLAVFIVLGLTTAFVTVSFFAPSAFAKKNDDQ
jgi:hypothetical protein